MNSVTVRQIEGMLERIDDPLFLRVIKVQCEAYFSKQKRVRTVNNITYGVFDKPREVRHGH